MSSTSSEQLEILQLKFGSLQEFNDWKEKEELATLTRYVQHRGPKTNMGLTITTKYYCHRSGVFKSKGKGERALKITGSCKIDQSCPSFIRTVAGLINIDVTYCKTHLGHQNEIRFLGGKVVKNFVNTINSRHRSALQTNYKVIPISDDTWSVASNTIEVDYLIKQNEPCSCKVICIECKCCVHLFSCTCYDYSIKNNMCKHIHAVRINSMVKKEDVSMDVICNPIENDEVCLKMPAAQQLTIPSSESVANKIQQLYNMIVAQAGTLDDQ